MPSVSESTVLLACVLLSAVFCSAGHTMEHTMATIQPVDSAVGVSRRAAHTHSHKRNHRCKHSEMKEPRMQRVTAQYPSRRSGTAPIRLHFQADTLDSMDASQKTYILDLLADAQDWFSQALNVVPVSGSLTMGLICKDSSDPCNEYYPAQCGNFSDIPDAIVTTGVTADTIIFVSAKNTAICLDGSTLAYAQACRRDQWDRPTVGWINFCPSETVVETDPRDIAHDLETAIHEITHILGFSPSSFAFFRDSDGNPRTSRCPGAAGCDSNDVDGDPPYDWANFAFEISTSTVASRTARGKTVQELVTPEVRRVAREHFACDTLEGAELEEFGGGGTAGSHFEKRVLHTELMIGSLGRAWESQKSPFTLAVLQDSGWYQVNYTAADLLRFGRGKGCDFVDETCTPSDPADPWCSTSNPSMCTFNRAAVGFCQIATYTSALPPNFQYFSDPTRGGADGLMDYCPLPTAYTNTRCDGAGGAATMCGVESCRGEKYGASSACFESSAIRDGYVNDLSVEGACYEFRCVEPPGGAQPTSLEIWGADGRWHSCDGVSAIVLSGYSGSIQCPRVAEVCLEAAVINPATQEPYAGGVAEPPSGGGALACGGACNCAAGYYAAGAYCLPCPAGTYKGAVGNQACSDCPPHSFSEAGAGAEADCECNAGREKVDGECVPEEGGFSPLLLYGAAGGGGLLLLALFSALVCRGRGKARVAPVPPPRKSANPPGAGGASAAGGGGGLPAAPAEVASGGVVALGQGAAGRAGKLVEVPFHCILDLQWVASGGFKAVYRAQVPRDGSALADVAVTVLLRDVAGPVSRPLPAEALPRHPRVTALIAAATDPHGQTCLLAEWAPCGSLYHTLARCATMGAVATNGALSTAAAQIAEGASFIAGQGFVHRSISLRSVMVSAFHPADPRLVRVKLGDLALAIDRARLEAAASSSTTAPAAGVQRGASSFKKKGDPWAELIAKRMGLPAGGLGSLGPQPQEQQRVGGDDLNLQVMSLSDPQQQPQSARSPAVSSYPLGYPEGAPSPVRWLAPEVVRRGQWSAKSDSWSLGVALCELFSAGLDSAPADPFPGMSDAGVRAHLAGGGGHPVPERCPPGIAAVVVLCTEPDPARRLAPQQAHELLLSATLRQDRAPGEPRPEQCIACGAAGTLVGLWPCGHASLCLEHAARLDDATNVCPVCCLPITPGKFTAVDPDALADPTPPQRLAPGRPPGPDPAQGPSPEWNRDGVPMAAARQNSVGSAQRWREAWGEP